MGTATPAAIYDTATYEVFAFQNNLTIGPENATKQCNGVIMRKADGALYCYEGGVFDHAGSLARENPVQSNGGDLLFLFGGGPDGTGSVQRLDMASEPPSVVAALSEEATHDFSASLDGDLLVNLDRNPVQQTRIYKASGGLQNLVASRSDVQWLDAGGHAFYYGYAETTGPAGMTIKKATRQSDGSYLTTDASFIPEPTMVSTFAYLVLTGPDVAFMWRGKEIVDLIGATQNATHDLTTLTGFATISDVRASASSLFVQGTDAAGNGGITRIDVPAFTATPILPVGDFSLTAISPSRTGELSFAGIRNADGRHVYGTVPAGSTTYTITDDAAPTVMYLQRMN